jgi:hypothetical protein
VNIYLALLLLVASFAAGLAMERHLLKSIIRELEQALESVLDIGPQYPYALNTIAEELEYTVWGEKHLNANTGLRKSNL